jgi:hypothetical protein
MSAVYGSTPIRRRRRSQAEMEAIRAALNEILAERHPMTVRQVFYQATTAGVVAKTEAEYKGTVCRLLADMRRDGEIPYTWLADATRWMRKPTTFSSAEAALKRTAETYRRALWNVCAVAVEIWLEKEALAGVLVEVTDAWDPPAFQSGETLRIRRFGPCSTSGNGRRWYDGHTRSGRRRLGTVCQGCGEIFTAARSDASWCSSSCRRKGYLRRKA